MKKKIKKTKNIKNKLTSDHSEVLLEEMNSNLKLILEDHAGLNKKIDTNHKEFQEFCEEVNFNFRELGRFRAETENNFKKLFEFQKGTKDNFKIILKYLSKINDEIQSIKSELSQIKSELKNKTDLTFFKILEKRIKKLEINYSELHSLILQQCN